MEKLKMHSPNLTDQNISKIRELFPGCVTEAVDESGTLRLAVDFEQLKQELSDHTIEGPQERYHLNWPGKREALLNANAPIAKTLRPSREQSVNFDDTKNIFIEGDNLEALKLLQETYLGKIKMIYIDPPYNTGKDFIYSDDFVENSDIFLRKSNQKDQEGNRLVTNTEANGRFHSDWLNMIYPRIKLARNLLCDDGMIFVSADENEAFNVKKVLDEIFGSDNCINDIVWKNRYNAAKEKHLAKVHEYIFVYSKFKESVAPIYVPPTEDYINRYFKNKDEKFHTRGPYRLQPLEAGKSMDPRPNLVFDIQAPDGEMVSPKRQWKWGKDRVQVALEKGELEFSMIKGQWSVSTKQYLRDENGEFFGVKPFSLIENIFTQIGTKEISELFGSVSFFPFPKPTLLLKHLLNISLASDGDIILDFFAGSATTAHAVMQLNAEDGGNRKFIMVQLPEPCDCKSEAFKAGFKSIADISKERIRRAGARILKGECHELWQKDVGFRSFTIDSSNMAEVYYAPDDVEQDQLEIFTENVKKDRNSEDLLFQVLVDWGVDLSLPIRRKVVQEKTVFIVDENALIACFDTEVTLDLVKELAGYKPLRAVFRDTASLPTR